MIESDPNLLKIRLARFNESIPLLTGVRYFLSGFIVFRIPTLRVFVLVPLGVSLASFGIGMFYAFRQFNAFMEWFQSFLPTWLLWLEWILIPIFVPIFLVIGFHIVSMMANLLAAPFNDLLAKKIELHLIGCSLDTEVGVMGFLKSILPSVWNELKKIFYFLTRTVALLVLFFIPLLNVISPGVWFVFSAWCTVVEYADFCGSNQGLTGSEVRERLRRQRLMCVGFGAAGVLMRSVPFINFIFIPVSVAGATIMWVEKFSED